MHGDMAFPCTPHQGSTKTLKGPPAIFVLRDAGRIRTRVRGQFGAVLNAEHESGVRYDVRCTAEMGRACVRK